MALDTQQLFNLQCVTGQVKEKRGMIERVIPEQNTAIVRGMFKKETDPSVYVGLKV